MGTYRRFGKPLPHQGQAIGKPYPQAPFNPIWNPQPRVGYLSVFSRCWRSQQSPHTWGSSTQEPKQRHTHQRAVHVLTQVCVYPHPPTHLGLQMSSPAHTPSYAHTRSHSTEQVHTHMAFSNPSSYSCSHLPSHTPKVHTT